jgi:hypothetical protein
MGRTLDEVTKALPEEHQQCVEARYQELKAEVEGLQELRLVAGKAQAEIAKALKVKQPSVSKIERQTDMYISTLRNYIKAIGGELELTVRLPSRPPLRLHQFGYASASPVSRKRSARPARKATSNAL